MLSTMPTSDVEKTDTQVYSVADADGTISDESSEEVTFRSLIVQDRRHQIQLRTMSWQKTAWLLAGDQICLAIMTQTWSLSVLGWVPGIITMIVAGALFWVTSITMHQYIMKNPRIIDICDFGYHIFGKSRIAYEFSAIMLLGNNILLLGFQILTAAQIFNTLSEHSLCTVLFSVIGALIGIILSIPRTLRHVSFMSIGSAVFMILSILLFLIFVGIEDHPGYGYSGTWPEAGPVRTYAFPLADTTWVKCLNAVLNITFLWTPQILFPSFIAEMEKPEDFPKSLAVLMFFSVILFIVPPVIGFHYLGQYSTTPMFASLSVESYQKASFAFVLIPTMIIGVIYANVTAKHIYIRILGKSHHAHSHTAIGWGLWVAVIAGIWILGFIFAEVIPSMEDFLSLLASVFDSFFGFSYFAIAYWHLHRGDFWSSPRRSFVTLVNIFIMLVAIFFLGPGIYATVVAIKDDYSTAIRPAFSCADLNLRE